MGEREKGEENFWYEKHQNTQINNLDYIVNTKLNVNLLFCYCYMNQTPGSASPSECCWIQGSPVGTHKTFISELSGKGGYTSTRQNGSFTGHWTFSMAPEQLLLSEVTSKRIQALEAPTSPTDSPEALKTAHMAESYTPELPRRWGLNVTLSIDQGTCPFKSPKGHCVSWWKIMFPRGKSTILWAYKLCHLQLK